GDLGAYQEFNLLTGENPLQLIGDVGILAAHEPRPVLDHSHAAAEAPIGLGQFEPHVAASEHDQMRWQIVKLERLDVRERASGLEPGHTRNRRVRAHVDEHAVADKHPRAAVVQMDLERLRGHEPAGAHDQLGTTRLEVAQVRVNLLIDHGTLSITNGCHIDGDTPRLRAVLGAVAHQRRYLCAIDLVLAGQAVDVGTGATDPATLHDGRPSTRSRHMPRQELAAYAAAKDQDFKSFRLGHACLRWCW